MELAEIEHGDPVLCPQCSRKMGGVPQAGQDHPWWAGLRQAIYPPHSQPRSGVWDSGW